MVLPGDELALLEVGGHLGGHFDDHFGFGQVQPNGCLPSSVFDGWVYARIVICVGKRRLILVSV